MGDASAGVAGVSVAVVFLLSAVAVAAAFVAGGGLDGLPPRAAGGSRGRWSTCGQAPCSPGYPPRSSRARCAAQRSAHSQLLAEGVGRELVHTAVAVHQERQYLQYNITL